MKILYFNCFAGISGDMTLGALVDLGVDQAYLIKELNKLSIADEFEIKVDKNQKMGIYGTKVDVILKDHHHDHSHGNEHHHDHDHNHDHNHDHEHRNLAVIKKIIEGSNLNDSVKILSMKIFMELARAEGKIHNKPIDEVHFHEVGAVDSIVDIVGTAICIDFLKVDKILSSTVELGGGFVRCAHGMIPVPAPATAEILTGAPVHLGRVDSETTTPTGAAILKALVHEFQDQLDFSITKTGYGLGTKDFSIPNVLRVFLAEDTPSQQNTINSQLLSQENDKQIMIETNIDDMNPEFYDYVEGLLFEAGARDVFKIPIMMKKGRPGIILSVLIDANKLELIERILFTQTSTLGLRTYEIGKRAMERSYEKIMTPYGDLVVKNAILDGKVIKSKFEYDVLKELAKRHNLPIVDMAAKLQSFIVR